MFLAKTRKIYIKSDFFQLQKILYIARVCFPDDKQTVHGKSEMSLFDSNILINFVYVFIIVTFRSVHSFTEESAKLQGLVLESFLERPNPEHIYDRI